MTSTVFFQNLFFINISSGVNLVLEKQKTPKK